MDFWNLPKLAKSDSSAITVKELITYISQFPQDSVVWIGDGCGSSNECREVWPMNIRDDKCDVLLEPGEMDE